MTPEMQYLDLTIRILICLAIGFETWGILRAIKGIYRRMEKWI